MRKLNIFYWLIAPLLFYSVFLLLDKLRLSHKEYFGFAENKQSEINLDKDVHIVKILVKTGDKVNKGQLLMTVNNSEIREEINQLSLAVDGLKLKNNLTTQELKLEMLKLERERDIEIISLRTQISHLQQEDAFYKSLMDNKNVSNEKEVKENPNQAFISQLNQEINIVRQKYDSNIAQYKKMMMQPKETVAEKDQYVGKKLQLNSELSKFNITAAFDGLIGSINVREGENVKAFTSMISYYESTPPLVLGYVQEKFDFKINAGDSVSIVSVFNPSKKVKGIIASKGNRIVEIPEKFRKIPEVKLYGIEVFINIPTDNTFLQKEVLRISQIE